MTMTLVYCVLCITHYITWALLCRPLTLPQSRLPTVFIPLCSRLPTLDTGSQAVSGQTRSPAPPAYSDLHTTVVFFLFRPRQSPPWPPHRVPWSDPVRHHQPQNRRGLSPRCEHPPTYIRQGPPPLPRPIPYPHQGCHPDNHPPWLCSDQSPLRPTTHPCHRSTIQPTSVADTAVV
jgi:hypothetical protein